MARDREWREWSPRQRSLIKTATTTFFLSAAAATGYASWQMMEALEPFAVVAVLAFAFVVIVGSVALWKLWGPRSNWDDVRQPEALPNRERKPYPKMYPDAAEAAHEFGYLTEPDRPSADSTDGESTSD